MPKTYLAYGASNHMFIFHLECLKGFLQRFHEHHAKYEVVQLLSDIWNLVGDAVNITPAALILLGYSGRLIAVVLDHSRVTLGCVFFYIYPKKKNVECIMSV